MSAHVSKSQTFRNVIYNTLLKGGVVTCQFAASSVVARNLSAADMGVVVFASLIIGFLSHFSDCGVGSAAVRRARMDQHHLDTAFTLKVTLGLGAFGTAMLLSPFAWFLCDHPAAGSVMRFLALNFLVSTVGFLPTIQLTREMNFRALIFPGIINAAVRAALAITLILSGWKFWSVVVADVGANLAGGIAMQCVKKIPLRLRFDRADALDLLRFGVPLMGGGVLIFLIFNGANFLVGAKMGKEQLGFYGLAFNWGTFICTMLADTVLAVLFPTFSAFQNDSEKMRRWYLKTVDLVAFIAVVANVALLANADAFLVILLGKGTDKWLPAAVTLQILCFYGIVRAITEPIGNCLMARGQTQVLLRSAILVGVVQAVLLVLAVLTMRIEWVAVAVLAAYATQAFIFIPVLRRELSVGVADLFKQLWPVVPALLGSWAATHALFPSPQGSLFGLAVRGIFTVSVAALIHGVFTRFRCFKEAAELVIQKFAGRGSNNPPPENILC